MWSRTARAHLATSAPRSMMGASFQASGSGASMNSLVNAVLTTLRL